MNYTRTCVFSLQDGNTVADTFGIPNTDFDTFHKGVVKKVIRACHTIDEDGDIALKNDPSNLLKDDTFTDQDLLYLASFGMRCLMEPNPMLMTSNRMSIMVAIMELRKEGVLPK